MRISVRLLQRTRDDESSKPIMEEERVACLKLTSTDISASRMYRGD